MLIRSTTTTLLAGLAFALGATALSAQPFHTQYGSNPIGKINGSDLATSEFPGQTRVQPNYTARYGLEQLRGGSYPNGRFWDTRLNSGSSIDPLTGVSTNVFNRNPFLRQWWNLPGGTFSRFTTTGFGLNFSSPAASSSSAPRAPDSKADTTQASGVFPGTGYASGILPGGYNTGIVPGSYGTFGYSPRRQASVLPSIVGGVLGAVAGSMVGGGPIGMLIGGAGGFLAGKFVADQLAEAPREGYYDNAREGYYNVSGQYNVPSYGDINALYPYSQDYQDMYYNRGFGKLNWLPGVGGAVLGATLGASGGVMGMIMGGGVGLLAGNVLGRILAPQSYYDGYGQGAIYPSDPYNGIEGFRRGTWDSRGSDTVRGSITHPGQDAEKTQASTLTPPPIIEDVASLKGRFLDKVEALEKAMQGGSAAERQSAHQEMESAREAYMKAKVGDSLEN